MPTPAWTPETGELWTLLRYDVESAPYVTLRLFGDDFALKRTIPIDLPGLPTMMHDFMITQGSRRAVSWPRRFRLGCRSSGALRPSTGPGTNVARGTASCPRTATPRT